MLGLRWERVFWGGGVGRVFWRGGFCGFEGFVWLIAVVGKWVLFEGVSFFFFFAAWVELWVGEGDLWWVSFRGGGGLFFFLGS